MDLQSNLGFMGSLIILMLARQVNKNLMLYWLYQTDLRQIWPAGLVSQDVSPSAGPMAR